MKKILNGGCLCGEVRFTINDEFRRFHLCHCIQCRKITSSAFAANLFTETASLTWTAGEHLTRRFEYPGRKFTKVFCTLCGSGLPFPSTEKSSIIIPAGSLDEEPTIEPLQNIFWEEHTNWLDAGMKAPCVTGFNE